MRLPGLHFLFGLATIIHFPITGLLMRLNYFDLDSADTLGRMLFRSNHIYITFCGLLNLLLYFVLKRNPGKNVLLIPFSIFILSGTLGLNFAFYVDPATHTLVRSLTRFSLIACFAGTASHLLYAFIREQQGR